MSRLLFSFLLLLTPLLAAPRDAQWQEVREAIRAGLPQTAIERLDPILTAARTEGAHAEAVKAVAFKAALEAEIQGERAEVRISGLETALEQAPAEEKPLMQAILAHAYWDYFQQNRWRFLRRTATAESPGPDLETWDLARLLAEIDRHFTAALAPAEQLQALPVDAFDALIPAGTVSDAYRPTLYDFLVHEALKFYQSGEQGAVRAETVASLEADGPIFAPTEAFLHWRPEGLDTPEHKAIALYQALLRFHAADEDRSAFFDADLGRLMFGANVAVGEERDARYEAALRDFIGRTSAHEISARARAVLGEQLWHRGEAVAAHALATEGAQAFPESVGGAQCRNLLLEIEAPALSIGTEQVWNAPWPTLEVTYRNVTQVYFRVVVLDFEAQLARSRWDWRQFDDDQLQELRQAQPVLEWQAQLPETTDFKERVESIAAPETLRPGCYAIIASHHTDFRFDDNHLSVAPIWVSNLALVTQSGSGTHGGEGLVLAADSGEPVVGAIVRRWQRDRQGRYRAAVPVVTDQSGRFILPASPERGFVLQAEHRGDRVASLQELRYGGRGQRSRVEPRTFFFTDRAIYRPGQTIHYKGICIEGDQAEASYEVVARQRVTVFFRDVNGQELARVTHVTNDYGSFSGTFTAPRDTLMGRMSLVVDDGPAGATQFSVEEYKRPKFKVELEAPAEAAKLAAPATIKGRAIAYTGAAIGEAKVAWRVERTVRLPLWCWWGQPPATQAIAHGETTTAADGAFVVQFPATPDRSVPVANEPVFLFTVHTDVTDSAGETRSTQRTVRVGYTALQATVAADDWLVADAPIALRIATTSLDGEPRAATGTIKVHALQQPERVQRAQLQPRRLPWYAGVGEPRPDPANPDTWELGEEVQALPFTTESGEPATVATSLPAGIYRASLETTDRFGHRVTARRTLHVLDPDAQHQTVKVAQVLAAPRWSLEPGQTFTALWGTGYETGRALVELESGGRSLQRYWTEAGRTQSLIELPVTEALRGGFTLRITFVRENRAYLTQRVVDVPWSNKALEVTWERFRSKLGPGEKETWTARIRGPGAERVSAEMVAALYDASLDTFQQHRWPSHFPGFRHETAGGNLQFHNQALTLQYLRHWHQRGAESIEWEYRAFPPEIVDGLRRPGYRGYAVATARAGAMMEPPTLAGSRAMRDAFDLASLAPAPQAMSYIGMEAQKEAPDEPPPDSALEAVSVRRNLNETAFFFPQLLSAEDGTVQLQFTAPEALTTWRFLGFAHDRELRAGLLTETAVTAKDLMVQPNAPRFVREGDTIEFTVKISNESASTQQGQVQLTFADAATQQVVDAQLGLTAPEQRFEVPAKQSRTYAWRLTVPDGLGFLTYKAVAAGQGVSDGEEGYLPVLSRRVLVSETLPLPMRDAGSRDFRFEKLLESAGSETLRHQSLTVQMTSQPAWYAVMALPYLMEYPYECSEQVFNRLYANALAQHVATSDPKIRRIFDLWRATPALDSPLEQNEDLKSVVLEETPWLRQAKNESEARRQVGLLFDGNRLEHEAARALQVLAERQRDDGLWAWFPGGPANEYISLYITTGFGRLRQLGVATDVAPAKRALAELDTWTEQRHRRILSQPDPAAYVPTALDALYLYGRSFFLRDEPIAAAQREAVDYFLRQAREYWVDTDSRQTQGHLALALQRFGDTDTPAAIVRSLRERSVSDAEFGMYWPDQERSWWWHRAPIETQALMIEVFAEVAADADAVAACQVWLLKQKQTQAWPSTKATADAVYALLLRGQNLLASDARVEVRLAGTPVRPETVEAGTGFYEVRIPGEKIRAAMGEVTVQKVDRGVSWGSVHWQYLEDVSQITPSSGTPLKLTKTLWLKRTDERGPVLQPVRGELAVGDALVIRLELQTDRDLEFVHLKDQRGSGTEPINVLSGYRYQDGLAYYESTRDTAAHFFIDYLPKGTYVFEYTLRVQLRGQYPSGLAEIQCLYAPEFSSHSGSVTVDVR